MRARPRLLTAALVVGVAVRLILTELTGLTAGGIIVPGYVAQVHTRFTKTGDLLMPCHEYCGLGHTQMIATVKVVPPEQFRPDAQGRVACGDDR